MTQKKTATQRDINAVWQKEWNHAPQSVNTLFSDPLFKDGYNVFKKYIPKGSKCILEVGAGSGRYGLKFALDFPESTVVITDILEDSVVLTQRYVQELGIKNVTIEREDANGLSFSDASFDVVFCEGVMQYLPSVTNAMKEMTRVLRPGGLLIVGVPNKKSPEYLLRWLREKRGTPSPHGFERAYTRHELSDLLWRYHSEVLVLDGFSFPPQVNSFMRLLDRFSRGACSRYFGSMIFAIGRKYAITVKHSGVIQLPSFDGGELGTLVTGEFEKSVPFPVKRTYFITDVKQYMSARGGHAHKTLNQAIFCIKGSFRLLLDDGEHQQKIYLRNPAYGIILGPKLWHSMSRFSRDCVILVLASDNYDEADYLRDHNKFLAYIHEHPDL